VLGINNAPVTIKSAEVAIIERAFAEGWIAAQPSPSRTGKRVAVVGSGPAGLAAADQLNRAGHLVTVFERADRIGGLLRYGIPEFKLEKRWLERRLALMHEEGVIFRTGCHIGVNRDAKEMMRDFDAVVLAGGSTVPRDLRVPGRELAGIHFAMEYLTAQNRACEGDGVDVISAHDKHVIIIGGGDTGADCLGTAHRQGARSVRQLELLERPPDTRAPQNPWPTWPNIFRTSSAHEEGGERHYAIATDRFAGTADGRVARLHATELDTKAPIEFDADLVLLAMGFVGPERNGLISELGIGLTERGTVARNADWMTNVPGVFATGDMQRGQSLIVWAIADGRSCARGVDAYLMGHSSLPAPVA
jgi:glutamate synthase (NADPH/NADH) small chain